MTLGEATLRALVYAGAAAVAAVMVAGPVNRALDGASPRWRLWLWAVLLAPLLTPSLVVGYAYGNLSLTLVRHPTLNALWYTLLLAARLAPVAVLVVRFAPSGPMSRSGAFCAQLRGGGSPQRTQRAQRRSDFPASTSANSAPSAVDVRLPLRISRWRVLRDGPGRSRVVAGAVVFLLGFAAFETASLMGVGVWTVWLFDAQTGGLPLTTSLQKAALPAVVQLLAVGLAIVAVTGDGRPADRGVARGGAIGWGWSVLALGVGCLWPTWVVLRTSVGGAGAAVAGGAMLPEVGVTLGYAAGGAAAAWAVGWWAARLGRAWLVPVCLPGLLGSLVLSLAVLVGFQEFAPRWYDTPAPLLLATAALLLPLAGLLWLLLRQRSRPTSWHAARLLQAGGSENQRDAWRLAWQLRGRPAYWLAALLLLKAAFDLTPQALLAPSGEMPATVRLYNLMHYGRSATLSSLVLITLAAVLAVAMAGRFVAAAGVRFATGGRR